MRVLVTGGAGFIGAHVCRVLQGCTDIEQIFILDDLSTGRKSNLDGIEGAELVVGSVLDEQLVRTLTQGIDAIVHLAAIPAVARSIRDPRATHDANATGTLVMLEAARREGCYAVVASSSSVYGRNAALPTAEDHPTRPASPYAASKLAAESYALAYARSFDLEVLVFRFFNVYGPLQRADHAYAAVIPAFSSSALQRAPLQFEGDGTQTRDFTYVGDVASVLEDALIRRVTCDSPVNLAFGTNVSLLALAAELEHVLGYELQRAYNPPRIGDVHDSQADASRLTTLFPEVGRTPIRDGLRETVAWLGGLANRQAGDPVDVSVSID